MDESQQAKRPVTALAGGYGRPLHPAVVHVPIGAWIAGAAFDVASHAVAEPAFLVRGATWLLVLGLLGAAMAALLGALDLFAIPIGTRAFRTALLHAGLTGLASVVFLADLLLRRGADPSNPTGAGPLALSLVGVLVLLGGGALGGHLVFRYGVRVVEESAQADGFTRPGPAAPAAPAAPAGAAGAAGPGSVTGADLTPNGASALTGSRIGSDHPDIPRPEGD